MPITVRFARDTSEEQKLIENGSCTFSITDRSKDKCATPGYNYFFYLSTKENGGNLHGFPGWKLLLDTGHNGIKRFGANCSIGEILSLLNSIYGQNNVMLIEK
jgi:hypothetical protein